LNGIKESIENERIQRVMIEIKKRAAEANSCGPELLEWKVHIESENNFPTAAGLASSASGYACLVFAFAQLYGLKKQEISDIARLGSGSACRSIYGGFVHWQKGVNLDGRDSIAVQVAPASHWPDLHVLILVVNDGKKKVASTRFVLILKCAKFELFIMNFMNSFFKQWHGKERRDLRIDQVPSRKMRTTEDTFNDSGNSRSGLF
jgi:diphosphomevalonate decarboxylase